MGTITLTSVTLSGTPVFNQIVNIKIRVTSDPDVAASYTDKGNFTVLPNGNFTSPVVISGLADSTSYTVWVTSACSDSSFTHAFSTPVPPSTVFWDVREQANPYADANLSIWINGVNTYTINGTETGSITVPAGTTLLFEAFGELASPGDNPELHMNAKDNTVEFYDDTNPDTPPPMVTFNTGSFTAISGHRYDVLVESTADVPAAPVACGTLASYTGGSVFPTIVKIDLGTGTGVANFPYDMFSIPDKLQVYYKGIKVIDTGYRGDSSYQSALDAELISRGVPTETIAGLGSGTASFNKTTADRYAIMYIYGPLSGTAWNVTPECPV